jgi:hypothetical protein
MKERKRTRHEQDCSLVRITLTNHTYTSAAERSQVTLAWARIERRAMRTSPAGKNYICHTIMTGRLTYCGRSSNGLNSVAKATVLKNLDSEEWCKHCVACIKKEQTLP